MISCGYPVMVGLEELTKGNREATAKMKD